MNSAPQSVQQAIWAIWGVLAISALSALLINFSGLSSDVEFIASISVYALCCIFPFKLARRSNIARYAYLLFNALLFLFFIADTLPLSEIGFTVSVLLVPLEIFIVYKLLQRESSVWFRSK